jgi:hypothetical protein
MVHRALGDKDVGAASGAGGVPQAITVGASPFTYTNTGPNTETIYIVTATASSASVTKGGVTIANQPALAGAAGTFVVLVGPGQSIIVTYSAAPTMQRDVL